jgi:hypothetical protein
MAPRNYFLFLILTALTAVSWQLPAASRSNPTDAPKQKVAVLQIDGGPQAKSGTLRLHGADARQQVLVTARLEDGSLRDYTRAVKYEVKPGNIVKVDGSGFVTPLSDGTATITAKATDGVSAILTVKVAKFKTVLPINFGNQIVPIFTKTSCNGGGCHGKSGGPIGIWICA